ncbi:MAG TPA: hypothetical protein VMM76_01720 [Pirellulaceae bacterium]|nr:hypothetical protein [Pirellulaceae bacterium]
MLVRQHVHEHTEWELFKWMILIALASVIALGVLTSVAGAADLSKIVREPAPLPSEVEDLAAPMGELRVEEPPPVADLAFRVWQVIGYSHPHQAT